MPTCIRCRVHRTLNQVEGETWLVLCRAIPSTTSTSAALIQFVFPSTRSLPDNALLIEGKTIGLCPNCILNRVPVV
jgi:hypothetical protein